MPAATPIAASQPNLDAATQSTPAQKSPDLFSKDTQTVGLSQSKSESLCEKAYEEATDSPRTESPEAAPAHGIAPRAAISCAGARAGTRHQSAKKHEKLIENSLA